MNVTLTWQEVAIGYWIGGRRRLASLQGEYKERHGAKRKTLAEKYYFNVAGACGECAVAKALGRYWLMGINQKKSEPDVWPDLQVRTLECDHYDLNIRDDDLDHFRYVLVLGDPPQFRIAGWIWGEEAKAYKDRHFDRGDRNEPCFWIPQSNLQPMEILQA